MTPLSGWNKPPLYMVDVDETLELPPRPGPVTLRSIMELKAKGAIIGICGNWQSAMAQWPDWYRTISCFGPVVPQGTYHYKPHYLVPVMANVPASAYILVGNRTVGMGGISDEQAARISGWKFLDETQFARGLR